MVLYRQIFICDSLHTEIPKHFITRRESHLLFWHKIVVNYIENNLEEMNGYIFKVILLFNLHKTDIALKLSSSLKYLLKKNRTYLNVL